MASFFDLTVGQQVEFQRVLAAAGFTDSDVVRVIREPNLASEMHSAIQPKVTATAPSWWRTTGEQLARGRQLWPNIVLPEPPKDFTPATANEVLLLHVPDTFDSLWNKVAAPGGYTKYRWEGVKSDSRNLRLAPNVPNRTEPTWLAFDPEHGRGQRPDTFWDKPNLAASEVFSALIQFPDWCLSWFDGASAPNLAGYQLKYDGSWSSVPCLSRWDGHRRLGLRAHWAGLALGIWSSPVVREC